VADTPVHSQQTSLDITISQGLTEARPDDTPEGLIDRADRALYQAKQSGRNCVAVG
jgi:PleD family two-component response regulator